MGLRDEDDGSPPRVDAAAQQLSAFVLSAFGALALVLAAVGLYGVVIGGALGLALAVVATRLLGGLLFEIDALDPLTFVGVPLVLGAAAYLPARRASRVHPVAALRTD